MRIKSSLYLSDFNASSTYYHTLFAYLENNRNREDNISFDVHEYSFKTKRGYQTYLLSDPLKSTFIALTIYIQCLQSKQTKLLQFLLGQLRCTCASRTNHLRRKQKQKLCWKPKLLNSLPASLLFRSRCKVMDNLLTKGRLNNSDTNSCASSPAATPFTLKATSRKRAK